MIMQRVDRLKEPPVKGRFYLVPAILWSWHGSRRHLWWPVIGNKHRDPEFFNFNHLHYHVDPRFLNRKHLAQLFHRRDVGKLGDVLSMPLNSVFLPDGPGKPQLRRMRCAGAEILYPFADRVPVIGLNKHHAGQQCARGKRGWVCPHKHVALGNVAPIDGVITCPLHGLRIDAETGKCLGPLKQKEAA